MEGVSKTAFADVPPDVPFYRNKVVGYFALFGLLGVVTAISVAGGIYFGAEEIIEALD